MRTNTLKQKLQAGQRVCGVFIEINSADLVEAAGYLGFDFAFLDAQHCGLTPTLARELIRAGDLTGMTSLVRVPRNDPAVILEYLEAGAGGIIVPNIASRADCQGAASAVRYPPAGTRGGFGRSRASGFGLTQGQVEYFRRANEEVLFLPLVEDRAALADLAGICTTPGVDVVPIGPGDMALSMGIPGGWKDPTVQAAVEQIRAAAATAGKPAMLVALDAADARALYAQGFQVILVSALGLLTGAARTFLKEIGRT